MNGIAVVTTVLMGVFGGVGLVLALYGLMHRPVRSTAWPAALAAGGAAFGALSDSFWTMTSLGLLALWLGFISLPIGDAGWRFRFGMVKVIGILGFLLLWPSLDGMTGGVVPCPKWVQDRIAARLVAGLDLRGGLRLVYTVDVAEAVKDKRDAYYEEMRRELAKLYAGHEGDDAPKEPVLVKLREVVDLSAPRSPANLNQAAAPGGCRPGQDRRSIPHQIPGRPGDASRRRAQFRVHRPRVHGERHSRASRRAGEGHHPAPRRFARFA